MNRLRNRQSSKSNSGRFSPLESEGQMEISFDDDNSIINRLANVSKNKPRPSMFKEK